MNFGSHVDGIVAVTAALVNVATVGDRQGRPFEPDPGDAAALGRALRLGTRRASDPSVAERAALTELAAGVRPVFEAVDAGDLVAAVATTNLLLVRYSPEPRLERHDGEPWHLHFHGAPAVDRSGWGGGVAMAMATVLGSEYADRLGVCAAPVCDRVFVDVSRNGTRRFCSEACQNRVKAAAHRARQRT